MFYTVYKITNQLNGKIYIGVHKTNDLEDSYMGSGKYLKKAQEKYGIENFTKECLEIFENPEDMFEMESKLVNADFVKDKNTYNLALGGAGGDLSEFIDYKKRSSNKEWLAHTLNNSKKGGEAAKWLYENDPKWVDEKISKISKGIMSYYESGGKNGFANRKHSDETKKKIGESNAKHQQGKNNSQFGKIWIYNLELKLSKKIKKEDFPELENEGWLRGRKMKF